MKHYITLLRPKHWAKNLFLFVPLFFAGKFFELDKIGLLIGGFFAFSFLASSIYIVNDYRDIEDDKKHPEKRFRPLASGAVNKTYSLIMVEPELLEVHRTFRYTVCTGKLYYA